jgi:radical SAM/Cys-rich protein
MPAFESVTKDHGLALEPLSIEALWVNITRRCNQACRHCHLEASPERTEQMNLTVMERCLEVLSRYDSITSVDITGGAPELHPHFDYFVAEANRAGKRVKVRTNLTVALDGDPSTGEGKGYLPRFFAEHGVEVIASLPHYDEAITDEVRGRGVFRKSLEVIRRLNEEGYASEGTGLVLNLVHNVSGPLLLTERDKLEAEFKAALSKHGLRFNRLYTVTNMPIGRFGSALERSGGYRDYVTKLIKAFSPGAAQELVCRTLVSVDYEGRLYDCDFNQVLGWQIKDTEPVSIFNFDLERLLSRHIRFGAHCFGCTAGGGSS